MVSLAELSQQCRTLFSSFSLSSSWCVMVSVLYLCVLYHCGDPALAGHLHSAAVLGNYPSATVANATRKGETADSLWHMRCGAISRLCLKLKGGLIINYSTLCCISNRISPGHALEDHSSWRKAHVFVCRVYFEPCLMYVYINVFKWPSWWRESFNWLYGRLFCFWH